MKRIQNNITIFIIVALLQLAVPIWMIGKQENIISEGTEYLFKTAPVDPYDAFKGRYIALNFEANRVKIEDPKSWNYGEKVFAVVETDSTGFAVIKDLTREQPSGSESFFSVLVQYPLGEDQKELMVELPFNKFFVEESKAPIIEKLYREMRIDSSKNTYAKVMIHDGQYALKGVYVDGKSIVDLAEESISK